MGINTTIANHLSRNQLRLGRIQAALTIAAMVFLFVESARASSEEDSAEKGSRLFAEGMELKRQNKCDEAIRKFEESLQASDRLAPRYEIANCYEKIGRHHEAWALYCSVAARAEKEAKEPGADKKEAKLRGASIARKKAIALFPVINEFRIVLPERTATLPGIEVWLDGARLSKSLIAQWRHLDIGYHTLRVTAPRRKPWEKEFRIDSFCHTLELAIPDLAPEDPPDYTATIVLSSVGAAALGLGAISGVWAMSLNNKKNELCPTTCAPESDAFKRSASLVDNARVAAAISTSAFAAGGLGVATALLQGLSIRSARREDMVALRITPFVSPRFVGIGVNANF